MTDKLELCLENIYWTIYTKAFTKTNQKDIFVFPPKHSELITTILSLSACAVGELRGFAYS